MNPLLASWQPTIEAQSTLRTIIKPRPGESRDPSFNNSPPEGWVPAFAGTPEWLFRSFCAVALTRSLCSLCLCGELISHCQPVDTAVPHDMSGRGAREMRADHQDRPPSQLGQHPLAGLLRLLRIAVGGRGPMRPR